MSYEEKGVWVSLAIAVGGYSVYLALVLPLLAEHPPGEVDYVPPMLWTIGGAIVAGIVLRILVEMFAPSESRANDVRDKEIDRLGERVGNSFLVIGALGALALAMLDAETFWIANVIYLGFALSALLAGIAKLVAYRRGVPRW